MNSPDMSPAVVADRFRWSVVSHWDRMSFVDLMAAALLLLWLGLYWFVLLPLAETGKQQRNELLLLKKQHADSVLMRQRSTPASFDTQKGFVDFLPIIAEREAQLVVLHELANKQGVRLGGLDYHQDIAVHLPVMRQSVRLKMQGLYAGNRQFLHELLARLPNLAVDRIVMESADDVSGELNVSMDVTLYYQLISNEGGERS